MPDRIIRDELLHSERWLGLPNDTCRVAYIALLLSADAAGDLPATPARLYRLWRDFDGINTPEAAEKLTAPMLKTDLIRFYWADPNGVVAEKLSTGTRYLHIPRYKQALRWIYRLFPLNPWLTDEQKQRIARNSPSAHPVQDGSETGAHHEPTTSAPDEVKRSEVKRSEDLLANGLQKTRATTAAPKTRRGKSTPVEKISEPKTEAQAVAAELDRSAKALAAKFAPPGPVSGNGQTPAPSVAATPVASTAPAVPGWSLTERGIQQRAMELGLPAHAGEGWKAWAARLIAADAALPPAQRRG